MMSINILTQVLFSHTYNVSALKIDMLTALYLHTKHMN